jgi:hypothetical protein
VDLRPENARCGGFSHALETDASEIRKDAPTRIRVQLYKGDDAGSSPGLCEDALGRLKD